MRSQEAHQPPAALPDGSMPLYANHPLPGMPGGGPPLLGFGWGPDFSGTGDVAPPHRQRAGLAIGLLIICGLAIGLVIAALAAGSGDPGGTAFVTWRLGDSARAQG
ncbi:hypothetical protein [Kribbella swartbergensis]